jgi:hypothetical protein
VGTSALWNCAVIAGVGVAAAAGASVIMRPERAHEPVQRWLISPPEPAARVRAPWWLSPGHALVRAALGRVLEDGGSPGGQEATAPECAEQVTERDPSADPFDFLFDLAGIGDRSGDDLTRHGARWVDARPRIVNQ